MNNYDKRINTWYNEIIRVITNSLANNHNKLLTNDIYL